MQSVKFLSMSFFGFPVFFSLFCSCYRRREGGGKRRWVESRESSYFDFYYWRSY